MSIYFSYLFRLLLYNVYFRSLDEEQNNASIILWSAFCCHVSVKLLILYQVANGIKSAVCHGSTILGEWSEKQIIRFLCRSGSWFKVVNFTQFCSWIAMLWCYVPDGSTVMPVVKTNGCLIGDSSSLFESGYCCPRGSTQTLLKFKVVGQRSRSHDQIIRSFAVARYCQKACRRDNSRSAALSLMKSSTTTYLDNL